jgi:hypothetical protein
VDPEVVKSESFRSLLKGLVDAIAAGLFVRTFAALAHRNVGFDRASLLVVTIDGRRSALGPAERAGVFARAVEAVRGVPGVAHAAASSLTPVSGMGWNDRFPRGWKYARNPPPFCCTSRPKNCASRCRTHSCFRCRCLWVLLRQATE